MNQGHHEFYPGACTSRLVSPITILGDEHDQVPLCNL
jgi:hypothetical protein